MRLINDKYLTDRFFYLFGGVILLFVVSFPFNFIFPIAQAVLVLTIGFVIVDFLFLRKNNTQLTAERILPKVFSLSDKNKVIINIKSLSDRKLKLLVIDELPVEFQKRDFHKELTMHPGEELTIDYRLRPVVRGEYHFGAVNIFVSTNIGLWQRRLQFGKDQSIPVFPSIIQMKDFELKAFNRVTSIKGLKKLRRLGHSYEFEQINNYVKGDDYRSINWKATGRRGTLMVNQYQDERSQQVYCIIDKSRMMKMPFDDLSLVDYAVNATLAISNIVLKKNDKAGLITFSDKLGVSIKAAYSSKQLNKILMALYNEEERHLEANYELLYHAARKLITGRSLILLFTNFESMFALDRVLPILRRINILHLLVVIFFENTEIEDFLHKDTKTLKGIYTKTVARQFATEKHQMAQKLKQFGIQSIITRPEDLSMNTINKYLELKARGLI